MTTITIERALLRDLYDSMDDYYSETQAGRDLRAAAEAALAAPATAPKHRTVSDDLIACLRGGRQCDADGVEVIMSRQACREAADILESWAIDQAPATAPEQPTWHNAPTCAGVWLSDRGYENPYRWGIYNVVDPAHEKGMKLEDERWFGPIPEDK